MILTHSFVVGGKGYRSGTKQDGKLWQSQSFKAYPFDDYVSVFLPPYVHEGMMVTVSGTVKKEVKGEYTNYSLQYPVVDTVYRPEQPAQEQTRVADIDRYVDAKPLSVNDNLPF